MPIILHGDAAFPGQGVVAETLNLQALDGYTVGGTLHLIQNNQVGFTTDPDDARSTRWASDLAKGFDVPIIHVNADDVEACIAAVRLAFAFRQEFGHDVADRPDRLPPLRPQRGRRAGLHAARDVRRDQGPRRACASSTPTSWSTQGVVTQDEVDALEQEIWDDLAEPPPASSRSTSRRARASSSRPASTSSTARPRPRSRPRSRPSACATLNEELLRVPEGFTVHPKLIKQLERRREAIGADGGIDWAHAEALAFASLLTRGHADPPDRPGRRARHVLASATSCCTTPRPASGSRRSSTCRARWRRWSCTTRRCREVACLGFEYGYSLEAPETLVLWEAQFGDFVNAAQVIIDQFIVSGLAKWGQTTRLTLLLPHGYEGSGPGALLRAPGALPAARRRGQHPRREPDDAGAVLPPAAPPGAGRQAAPAGDHDAEVAAAPAAGDEPDRAPVRRAVLPRARRAAGRRREGHAPDPLHRQDLLRPRRPRDARGQRAASRSAASSCSTRSRRARSSSSSAATRTCARSCGSRRSRATWAPARTCRRACCRSCPSDLEFGYIGRPERAVAGRGLPGRARRASRTGSSDRARPVAPGRRCTRSRRRASADPATSGCG